MYTHETSEMSETEFDCILSIFQLKAKPNKINVTTVNTMKKMQFNNSFQFKRVNCTSIYLFICLFIFMATS